MAASIIINSAWQSNPISKVYSHIEIRRLSAGLLYSGGNRMKTVLGCIRRANEQFHMIEAGDRIAVGVSGGKDSLLLLYAMSLYRKFCKNSFEVEGIMLGMDAP